MLNISSFQAHTLVSPQGVISKAIFSAAGPDITKIYQAPQPGEITKTPGFLLACSHVIHTNCSKWDGGKGEAVSIVDDQDYLNTHHLLIECGVITLTNGLTGTQFFWLVTQSFLFWEKRLRDEPKERLTVQTRLRRS